MSYTEMNMFVPRIWGFDLRSTQAQVALQAGWSRADILWEGLMEAANKAALRGDRKTAAKTFRRAFWVAKLAFARGDLRHATVQLNLGILARKCGNEAKAQGHFKTAALHWDRYAEANIAAMTIAPRARSSLFHLRMEALHR
nr:tetratricopeptide repeat-containing protein [Roseovarius sp.]